MRARPVQLVVSFGMLDRLENVLARELGLDPRLARERRELIAAFATLGPAGGPALTLGGVGTMPVLDAEDGHVLDTARAGRADWLVTANLRDFVAPSRARPRARPAGDGLAVLEVGGEQLLVATPGSPPPGSAIPTATGPTSRASRCLAARRPWRAR